MKKLTSILIVLTLLLLPVMVKGESVKKEGTLKMFFSKNELLNVIAVIAEPEALKHEGKFYQALRSPGKEVLVEKREDTKGFLPFSFKKIVEVEEEFIVFNKENNTVSLLVKKQVETRSSIFLLFTIIAIIMMVVSNFMYKLDKGDGKRASSASSLAFFAIFVLAPDIAIYSMALGSVRLFVAYLSYFILSMVGIEGLDDKESCQVMVTYFYIFMVLYIYLMFLGA